MKLKLSTTGLLLCVVPYVASAEKTVISSEYLCKTVKSGNFDQEKFAEMMKSGHYEIDNPDFVCNSDTVLVEDDDNVRRLRKRELGTTTNGVGGDCDNTYKRWYWATWYRYTYETMYNVCDSGLKCIWNECRSTTSSTSYDKDTVSGHLALASWIYSDLGGSKTTDVPSGYTRLSGNERHAVLKVNNDPTRCVLVHRATYDHDEIYTDLASQFMACSNKHGNCVNPAFWDSYQHIVSLGQTSDVTSAMANHGCLSFDLVGHSLGGATMTMALVDLGNNLLQGRINNVYFAGNPRATYSGFSVATWHDFSSTCNNIKGLVNGNIYRFARFKRTNDKDGDPVPSMPLDWHHCSDEDIALVSNDVAGTNPLIMEGIGNDKPNDSLWSLDDAVQWVWSLVTNFNTQTWHSATIYKAIVDNGVVCNQ